MSFESKKKFSNLFRHTYPKPSLRFILGSCFFFATVCYAESFVLRKRVHRITGKQTPGAIWKLVSFRITDCVEGGLVHMRILCFFFHFRNLLYSVIRHVSCYLHVFRAIDFNYTHNILVVYFVPNDRWPERSISISSSRNWMHCPARSCRTREIHTWVEGCSTHVWWKV